LIGPKYSVSAKVQGGVMFSSWNKQGDCWNEIFQASFSIIYFYECANDVKFLWR